ncbi:MAG: hypothetical protein AB7L71_04890 [Vicinamibacterales bacterium]
MDDRELNRRWQADDCDVPPGPESIVRWLEYDNADADRALGLTLLLHGATQGGIVVLACFCMIALSASARSLSVVFGVVSAVCLLATTRVWRFWRVARRPDAPVVTSAQRRIAFAEGTFAAWLWVAAFTPALATIMLTILVDSRDGGISVNSPVALGALMFVMTAIGYVSTRAMTVRVVDRLRAGAEEIVRDPDHWPDGLARRRRLDRYLVLLAVVLLATLVILSITSAPPR